MEQQGCKIETLQEKNLFLHEENNKLKSSVDSMERSDVHKNPRWNFLLVLALTQK